MPAKQGKTFQDIMKDLKARRFSPIYILMGEEAYYIDQITNYIAENVLTPAEQDFNLNICFGADVSAVQVTDMAKRFPMMAEYQVVIVKEAQNIHSLDALEKYLKNPAKTTILVWCHKNGKIDARKKVISLAEAHGVVFESKKLKEYQLAGFMQNYLAANKITIEPKATQMMADHIGADLSRLTSELDKVALSLSENDKRITPDIVEKEVGVSKNFNTFELRDAIVNRNVFKANQIVNYFISNPKAGSLYSFLPLLFSYFQNLMIVFYSPNNKSESDIVQILGLKNNWGAKEYIIGMRNYSARKTMDIIAKIREVDAKSKGLNNVSTGAGDLMKEVIFFILH
ncbi:DNA polymerase III subunit delta [Prevotella pallens]|uniref:DNA polymerase III subunit delta n=1 Tax=Prevotella pallens TaxID=60133 RepID=A0A379F0A0_9BACT|nr:DNA polymerase III subunit delta [Prevotella pallens]SUC12076.1 DNA polymerase III subunit delta [Prevotella pallens]